MQGSLGMLGDAIEWRTDDSGRLQPYLRNATDDRRVVWAPLPGSQRAFLECPVLEVLYEGGRGFGKSDCLLMAFAQHVGRGFGRDWRGIIFRRTSKELKDIKNTAERWFHELFPNATYNKVEAEWRWATGESLRFSHFDDEEDYWGYHGQQFTFIGWEELTTWPNEVGYKRMFSCLRSSNPNVPRMVRSNTNPYGIGHSWVKERFQLPGAPGVIGPLIRENGKVVRCSVHGEMNENFVLLHADPDYPNSLRRNAESPEMLKAWLFGDWDIVAGGMFSDLWRRGIHIVPSFPAEKIPKLWRIDRSYDDGQAKPFSVGWWLQSNGEAIEWDGRRIGEVRGDMIRFAEWYGWNGHPNKGLMLTSGEIATGIIEREKQLGLWGRVVPGPADTAIWNTSQTDRAKSVASEMRAKGVNWLRGDKGPGSREQGWKVIRAGLKHAIPVCERCKEPKLSAVCLKCGEVTAARREEPGIYVTTNCTQSIRLIPVVARDETKPDDIDTEAEDHIADEWRYELRRPKASTEEQTAAIY